VNPMRAVAGWSCTSPPAGLNASCPHRTESAAGHAGGSRGTPPVPHPCFPRASARASSCWQCAAPASHSHTHGRRRWGSRSGSVEHDRRSTRSTGRGTHHHPRRAGLEIDLTVANRAYRCATGKDPRHGRMATGTRATVAASWG
jgi:hypothetical protein